MSAGTQWELIRSRHLEDRLHSTVGRIDTRRRRFEPGSVEDQRLSPARGVFIGTLLGCIAWLAIFASGFAIQSLLFG